MPATVCKHSLNQIFHSIVSSDITYHMLTRHIQNHIVWCVLNLTSWISACKWHKFLLGMTDGVDEFPCYSRNVDKIHYVQPHGMIKYTCSSIYTTSFSMGRYIAMVTGGFSSHYWDSWLVRWSVNENNSRVSQLSRICVQNRNCRMLQSVLFLYICYLLVSFSGLPIMQEGSLVCLFVYLLGMTQLTRKHPIALG